MAKLLIAEDNDLLRWSLTTSLEREGHTVHAVAVGPAAIEAVRSGDYPVIIADYDLPEADGLQVLLCAKARRPDVHVIVITGQPTRNLERLARDMGAFEFLEKPFQFSMLKEAVDFALATPERRKGPRGCCGRCTWQDPCGYWARQETARAK